jgi:hypothetical protein
MNSIVSNAPGMSLAAFFSLVKHPLKFRIFLFKNLPAAYFSGLKIEWINETKSAVSIRYKWFTRNPFRCTYFACLSMAAEMSTGVLAMAHTYRRSPRISMLVTGIEGKFYKKATGLTRFICDEGKSIQQTIETLVAGESKSITVLTSGFNEKDELIAEFGITWSFKSK